MLNKHIDKTKELLQKWDPLGDKKYQVENFYNYEIVTIEILHNINRIDTVDKINAVLRQTLKEAFFVELDMENSFEYAKELKKIITK